MDLALFHAINHSSRPAWDPFFLFVSNRTVWWWVCGLATLGVILRRDRRVWAAWLLTLVAVGMSDWLSAFVLKDLFHRPRPCHVLSTVRLVAACGNYYGFPSNHAANGMAIASATFLAFRSRWTLFALVGALLVGFSRVYLGVHYPGDILGGFLVGALVASMLFWLARLAKVPFPQGNGAKQRRRFL